MVPWRTNFESLEELLPRWQEWMRVVKVLEESFHTSSPNIHGGALDSRLYRRPILVDECVV